MPPRVVHNLTFHGVGEPPRPLQPGEARVWVGTRRFLSILDAVRDRDDVRVSFDDGNRSDVELALPALRQRAMTATFFVLAGRLGGPYHLGGDDLQSLVRAGMTIGSHGLHHRDWRRIGDGELTRELVESRQILERVTGQRVTRASVPFGSYDRHVLARLRRDGGYDRVFTSDGGAARPDAWLQARTSVTAGDSAATLASPAHVARAVAAHRAVKRVVKRWR